MQVPVSVDLKTVFAFIGNRETIDRLVSGIKNNDEAVAPDLREAVYRGELHYRALAWRGDLQASMNLAWLLTIATNYAEKSSGRNSALPLAYDARQALLHVALNTRIQLALLETEYPELQHRFVGVSLIDSEPETSELEY